MGEAKETTIDTNEDQTPRRSTVTASSPFPLSKAQPTSEVDYCAVLQAAAEHRSAVKCGLHSRLLQPGALGRIRMVNLVNAALRVAARRMKPPVIGLHLCSDETCDVLALSTPQKILTSS